MEKVRIDIVPMGVTPNAHASQYDVARVIRFLLYNQGTAYTLAGTETITVKMTKPDGTEETVSVTNTSSDYVDFITTDGLLDQAGLYPCEISIVNGTYVIGSKNFNLRVEPDPYNGKGLRVVTVGPADICTFEPTISEPLVNVKCELTPSLDGYSAVNLTACGVNLWDEEWEVGGLNTSTGVNWNTSDRIRSKNYISIKPSTSIYIKYPTSGVSVNCCFYDANKTFISAGSTVNSAITIPSNAFFMRFATYAQYGTTYNNDISILYPSDTTPAYHAYTGNAYAIALGDTYYGGTLDVTRGKLTVTSGYVDLGTLNYTYDGVMAGVSRFNALVSDIKVDNVDVTSGLVCSEFTPDGSPIGGSGVDKTIAHYGKRIYINDNDYSDKDAFKTAMDGVKLVYNLATPIVIDLGSGTVVTARAGEVNNVFADCGQTELKYLTIEV